MYNIQRDVFLHINLVVSVCSFVYHTPKFALSVPSIPVKRWNFRKAKWSHYIVFTNEFAKALLLPDSLDVDAVLSAAWTSGLSAGVVIDMISVRNLLINKGDISCRIFSRP